MRSKWQIFAVDYGDCTPIITSITDKEYMVYLKFEAGEDMDIRLSKNQILDLWKKLDIWVGAVHEKIQAAIVANMGRYEESPYPVTPEIEAQDKITA